MFYDLLFCVCFLFILLVFIFCRWSLRSVVHRSFEALALAPAILAQVRGKNHTEKSPSLQQSQFQFFFQKPSFS